MRKSVLSLLQALPLFVVQVVHVCSARSCVSFGTGCLYCACILCKRSIERYEMKRGGILTFEKVRRILFPRCNVGWMTGPAYQRQFGLISLSNLCYRVFSTREKPVSSKTYGGLMWKTSFGLQRCVVQCSSCCSCLLQTRDWLFSTSQT